MLAAWRKIEALLLGVSAERGVAAAAIEARSPTVRRRVPFPGFRTAAAP